jgi:error-prone DNA polymerase
VSSAEGSPASPGYAPLWCKSSYSFLEGASQPDELIEEAHRLGIGSLALTDRDGVYGMVRAFVKAKELGVRLLAGAQVTVAAPGARLVDSPVVMRRVGLHDAGDEERAALGRGPGWGDDSDRERIEEVRERGRGRRSRQAGRASAKRTPQLALGQGEREGEGEGEDAASQEGAGARAVVAPSSTLVLLAGDRSGWAGITRLLTAGRRRCDKGESLVSWQEVCEHAPGVLALWGGRGSLLDDEAASPELLDGVAGPLREAFGDRLYAMASRHLLDEEVPREARLRARAARAGVPLLAAGEVLYHQRARRPLQDVLTCIRHGCSLTTAGRRLRGNDEHDLLSPRRFAARWADDPQAVARTLEVAARCRFSLAELRYRYPSERLPDGTTSAEHLRRLAWQGAYRRFNGPPSPNIARQLESELALIEELDYPGYFLTMYEIVEYCHRRGILCQGRGSAANSVVCFCLGVTAVDPMRMGLLFERFLSRERAEPPDIDLDVEHERREEVIQHVYHVYGRDHAAMVCNIIRYRSRSAVRDVGKALGIPETALDRAAKLLSSWGDELDEAALRHADLSPSLQPVDGEAAPARPGAAAHLARLASELLDFPRHLSIHPGGFLLGHEPVHDLVPIENASMPGRTVIQWDKDDLEEIGLFKVDLLALGALYQLHLCFDLLRHHRGLEYSMASIPAEDAATYAMMCTADTIGVFQIESRAQMSMLPRLKPDKFYDLVIEISLVRPGPISGGMVHPFLRRKNGLEEVVYPHPCLKDVLHKTLGVPLFQEQVMKLAIVAADYTPGEADQLRRDMAAWRRTGRIEQHRERLITRMQQKGIEPAFAERVFEQIRGFGEYGFPESHAASFALIAYATSWLRCHYLPEFTCALLNAQPMGFYQPATILADAQRHGVEVRAIDVAASEWDATLEPHPEDETHRFALRVGLRWITGLAVADAEKVLAARGEAPFRSVEDFARRTRLSTRAHTALASAGALGSLQPVRRDALWQLAGWSRRQDDGLALGAAEQAPRFAALDPLDEILWDYAASEHSTRGHPLGPLRAELTRRRWPSARILNRMNDGRRVEYVGLVICRQRPATASGVTFMTLEDETGFVNLVIWSQVFEQHAVVARTSGLLGITGRLQVQEGITHLIAEQLWQPRLSRAVAVVDSRDFH